MHEKIIIVVIHYLDMKGNKTLVVEYIVGDSMRSLTEESFPFDLAIIEFGFRRI